ncbi:MAG: hypothetical protein EXR69_12560, partial [Myxococcales bacterium]|nr:hypothetical protein [Myxococcales bacterium]
MPIYDGAYGNNTTRSKRSGYTGEPGPGSLYTGSGPSTPSVDAGYDTRRGPGSMNVELADPGGTVKRLGHEQMLMQEGLRAILFGTSAPDVKGEHGGILGVGNVPVVGDLLRGGTDLLGGVLGGVLSAAGQVADRVDLAPNPLVNQQLEEMFAAIPEGSVVKQEALTAISEDRGLFGTDLFTKWGHIKSMAIAAWAEEQSAINPDLMTGLLRPSASISDTIANLFGVMTFGERIVERVFAGWDNANGNNQLDNILLVGSGAAAWDDGDRELSPIEALVYAKRSEGEWTDEQALDYLASHGRGFSHDKLTQFAATIFLDPLTWGSLGAGALAKLGKVGYELANIAKQAEQAAALARELVVGKTGVEAAELAAKAKTAEEVAAQFATRALKEGPMTRLVRGKLNPVAQAAHSRKVGNVLRKYGAFYGELAKDGQLASLGRMAKITRTVVDPLHMWGQSQRTLRAIEEGSQQVVHAVVSAHGEFTHIDNIRAFGEMEDVGTEFIAQYERGLAIAAAQHLRRIAGINYRAVQWGYKKLEWLNTLRPSEHMKGVLAGVNQRTMTELTEDTVRNMRRTWTAAENENLARRLAVLWGGKDEAQWLEELTRAGRGGKPVWSMERKALLHQATFGSAVEQLHAARRIVQQTGQTGLHADRLHEIILVNKTTLTDLGAEGLLNKLAEVVGDEAKLDLITKYMYDYPELRNFVKDRTSAAETVDEFVDFIEKMKNYLPTQIKNSERPQLPEALRDFDAKMTWRNPLTGESEGIYTLAFRPQADYLWGLKRNTEGVLDIHGNPWMDQVSEGLTGYTPVREMSYNIVGKPIVVGKVLQAGARFIDGLEASGRTIRHGVTGSMVGAAARAKFVAKVTTQYESAGVSQSEVEKIWQAIMDYMEGKRGYSGARGLGAEDLWTHVGRLTVSNAAEHAGLNRRTLLGHVLDAYDGDLRFIGTKQKMTGRVKNLVYEMTGNNFVGEIAEHAWPLLKFRLDPFFAAQEVIEPWVLNGMRGASIAGRATAESLTEADQMALAVFRNMTEKNLMHMADNDIAELAKAMGWGKDLEALAKVQGSAHQFIFMKMASFVGDFTKVRSIKQLNMMRTWQKNLGREMRGAMENAEPGRWDDIVMQARLNANEMLSEDEVAVFVMYEKMAANDVKVVKMFDPVTGKFTGWDTNFTNAIRVGQHAVPSDLGELPRLDLDHAAARMGLRGKDGTELLTASALREALKTQNIKFAVIRQRLTSMQAHPDYIQRFDSALRFSYDGFWTRVQEVYSLTPAERTAFEQLYVGLAEKRNMTAVEYLSQVYHPQIARGTEHAVGSLGASVNLMRGGRTETVSDLAQLAGVQGVSTKDDLYRQMGAIMSQHLDPSAKLSFLREFMDAKSLPSSLTDVLDTWERLGASDLLAERIMHFVQGVPGTGPRVAVADDAVGGIAAIRAAATDHMATQGHPRNLQRSIFDDSPSIAREVAAAHEGNPATFMHVATRSELAGPRIDPMVVKILSDITTIDPAAMRAEVTTLPTNVRNAYEAQLLEARSLYQRITKATADGGLGIKVRLVASENPYASAAAMRADLARGVIKVPRSGYWHPIFYSEDLLMQRVVKDVFGHGQEDNLLNSHDAFMSAAAMYSNEGRAVMLSDEFARMSWEQHSQSVIPAAVARPETVAEYNTRFGQAASTPVTMATDVQYGDGMLPRIQTRSMGRGVSALPDPVQREFVGTVSHIRNEFPDVPWEAVDVANLPPGFLGYTLEYQLTQPTVVISPLSGWQVDDAVRTASRARRRAAHEARLRLGSAPFSVSGTPTGDIYHEFGHVLDAFLHREYGAAHGLVSGQRGFYLHQPLSDFLDIFRGSNAQKALSEYSYHETKGHAVLKDSDMFAELFDLAFNPEHIGQVLDPALEQSVAIFRQALKDSGAWVPGGRPLAATAHAGETVAEANAAGAAIRAEHRVGMLPQPLLDR